MSEEVKREDMRFTIVDTRHDTPYAGPADTPGNNAALLRSVPVGNKSWYDLEVHESVAPAAGHLKVVRVR